MFKAPFVTHILNLSISPFIYPPLTAVLHSFTYLVYLERQGAVLGLHCYTGYSLVVKSGGYSLVLAGGRLISVASLVVGHRL